MTYPCGADGDELYCQVPSGTIDEVFEMNMPLMLKHVEGPYPANFGFYISFNDWDGNLIWELNSSIIIQPPVDQ